MTKIGSSENFEDRRKFFREPLTEICWPPPLIFLGQAARRRRPKLTGAPPPTQCRRRRALFRGGSPFRFTTSSSAPPRSPSFFPVSITYQRGTLAHRRLTR